MSWMNRALAFSVDLGVVPCVLCGLNCKRVVRFESCDPHLYWFMDEHCCWSNSFYPSISCVPLTASSWTCKFMNAEYSLAWFHALIGLLVLSPHPFPAPFQLWYTGCSGYFAILTWLVMGTLGYLNRPSHTCYIIVSHHAECLDRRLEASSKLCFKKHTINGTPGG